MSGFSDFDFELDRVNELAKQQAHSLDNQLHVQFFKHAELNSARTKAEGRKIFEEFVYIRILIPANRLNIIERRVTEDDKTRFARQYTAFLQGAEQLSSGTPLDQIPGLTAAQVLELRALKVDTVEQLAGMADSTAQLLGTGGPDLKRRASLFLARVTGGERLLEENERLKAELAALVNKLAQTPAGTETGGVTVTAVPQAPAAQEK
jgi:hypothetical protein